ncbi:helix-turn-helix transcriptional regulator [Kitasatospora sp. YST-16]|uniref:helix-turn-helix domain-containing protein n=1 Tax=Kitasatospora sp. YST-16 TaxID=2998080 RepID=UPI0022852C9E|nr:helix-turn-helix transcriptional regulator [Kitasatospora sp. YST-16]WAL73134.1 helix-turn-helix transcriptional regulator [Kitasatospora sp. YST-16]WNW39188.1 helix-turn-helix transcriptional regulator [Streptomyces sp. Li-HN-5-13]
MAAQERALQPERSVRDLFGYELREARKRLGLSLVALSKLTTYSKTHLGNIETADREIPPDLPAMLDKHLGTGGLFGRLYRLVHLESFPNWSRRFMELEQLASYMRKYVAGSFPGLWQTAEYGRAAIRLGRPRADEEEVERLWAARAARQEMLSGDLPPFLWVVLDEAVVRRWIGGPEVMYRQIEHVLNISRGPNAVVQVLPFNTGGHGAMGGSITLLDFLDAPRVAYLEGAVSGQLLESPEEVHKNALTYDLVQAAALPPQESQEWLLRAMEEIRA